MPSAVTGGSIVTGASIVDGTVGASDLATGTVESFLATSLSVYPKPTFPAFTVADKNLPVNTTMRLGKIFIPTKITVNKISWRVTTHRTDGTVKIAIYSDDGQTKKIEVESGTISANGVKTATLGAAVELLPGCYYVGLLANGTTDFDFVAHSASTTLSIHALLDGVTSEAVLVGNITVTASTIPATIDPTAITVDGNACPVFRLDN